ncbi:hypothetical protein Fmac_015741 [Flemingia macrophylla]|uniref:Uncharacterized protein n=1 Tax=Flemingia macrophylla TaxID=520843 RepID=A0ABD1MFE7_9FABA
MLFHRVLSTVASPSPSFPSSLSRVLRLTPKRAFFPALAMHPLNTSYQGKVTPPPPRESGKHPTIGAGHSGTDLGSILSAGTFVFALVVGVVIIYTTPFAIDPTSFIRDVLFYVYDVLPRVPNPYNHPHINEGAGIYGLGHQLPSLLPIGAVPVLGQRGYEGGHHDVPNPPLGTLMTLEVPQGLQEEKTRVASPTHELMAYSDRGLEETPFHILRMGGVASELGPHRCQGQSGRPVAKGGLISLCVDVLEMNESTPDVELVQCVCPVLPHVRLPSQRAEDVVVKAPNQVSSEAPKALQAVLVLVNHRRPTLTGAHLIPSALPAPSRRFSSLYKGTHRKHREKRKDAEEDKV